MLILDVNVLVYAFNEQSDRHATYVDWLSSTLAGSERVGLLDASLSGFMRIVTNPRIFPHPSTTTEALAFVDAMINADATVWLPSTAAAWTILGRLVAQDSALRGNHIPHAYLAATVIAHGATLATADRGFARYPGLKTFDPASAT